MKGRPTLDGSASAHAASRAKPRLLRSGTPPRECGALNVLVQVTVEVLANVADAVLAASLLGHMCQRLFQLPKCGSPVWLLDPARFDYGPDVVGTRLGLCQAVAISHHFDDLLELVAVVRLFSRSENFPDYKGRKGRKGT